MAVMIQIRNVPEQVNRVLKARSALLQQLRGAEPFRMKRSSAALIRKERDAA